jgi:hypothetical protein
MFLFLTSSNIHFQTFKFARYSLMEFSHVISDYLVNFYFDAKDSREDPAAAFLYFIQRYIHTIVQTWKITKCLPIGTCLP